MALSEPLIYINYIFTAYPAILMMIQTWIDPLDDPVYNIWLIKLI